MGDALPNFSWKELECHCGCGSRYIDGEALSKLQILRTMWNRPMRINSACRCPKHNKEVGGALRSNHISDPDHMCTAFDVQMLNAETREEFISLAKNVGFNGIGVAKTFVHIDTRAEPTEWTY